MEGGWREEEGIEGGRENGGRMEGGRKRVGDGRE